MRRFLSTRGERGQTSTEYMIAISVIVIAVVGAAYVFVPSFQTGTYDLSNDVSSILDNQGSTKGGWGLAANNASGGGYDPTAGQQKVQGGAAPNKAPPKMCQMSDCSSDPTTATYDPNANAGE